jgi:hypothetical protein
MEHARNLVCYDSVSGSEYATKIVSEPDVDVGDVRFLPRALDESGSAGVQQLVNGRRLSRNRTLGEPSALKPPQSVSRA